jgi:hypothetical protein
MSTVYTKIKSNTFITGNGLENSPSYIFGNNVNTGIWSSGINTVNVSTNGTEAIRVNSSGTLNALNGVVITNTLQTNGSVSSTGVNTFANGTSALPTITFTSDVNTGIYTDTVGELSLTAAGTNQLTVSETSTTFLNPPTSTISTTITAVGPNIMTANASSGVTVCDTSSNAVALTLPPSGDSQGKMYIIYLVNDGNDLTISPDTGDTISNGTPTPIVLYVATQVIKLLCIGTNWVII